MMENRGFLFGLRLSMGNAGLGGLVWVKRGHVVDMQYGTTGQWTDVERQETGEPPSAAELKRQSLVRGCLP